MPFLATYSPPPADVGDREGRPVRPDQPAAGEPGVSLTPVTAVTYTRAGVLLVGLEVGPPDDVDRHLGPRPCWRRTRGSTTSKGMFGAARGHQRRLGRGAARDAVADAKMYHAGGVMEGVDAEDWVIPDAFQAVRASTPSMVVISGLMTVPAFRR